MERNELIEIQKDAASALDAGARLAARASARRNGAELQEPPTAAALGAFIANPGVFWAGASAIEGGGNEGTVLPIALATRYASAKLAAGDFGFVRESLVGQSQWLGVLAIQMAQKANAEKIPDRAMGFMKLALAAQRQAATTLATAAALNKFDG